MRHLILAGVAAATFATSATAQETCEQHRTDRTVGTVAGAGIGAVLGGVIAGGRNTGLGAILGAVGGGVAGNQLTKGPADCQHAYGYYDKSSQWHAQRTDSAVATGFYDRDGRWVQGAPAGYYDRDGRWISSDANRGYRDRNGYWVPAGATNYYADGNYVTAQPVVAQGYGDNRGSNDNGYGNDRYYGVVKTDIRGRIARTGERIDRAVSDGSLSQDQARRARYDLDRVNRLQSSMRRYRGQLSQQNFATVDARLQEINGRIRASRDQARTNY